MQTLKILPKTLVVIASALLFGAVAQAQSIWSQDFTGFTAGTDFIQGVSSYTYGFDGDGTAAFDPNTGSGDNVKLMTSGLWAKAGDGNTTFGFNDFGGGDIAAQPNEIGQAAMRGVGVFLSSSLFTEGSGVYRFNYDLIADSGANNRNARIWIGTSSTHDQTAANGWGFNLAGVNPSSEPPALPWATTGATTVGTVYSDNLDTSTSYTGFLDFNYVAGEDVAIVFGTTNTNAAFDNLSISVIPEHSSFALMAGLLGILAATARRR